jgi:predicted  nucleic acid-binding Zn-ribbon protein
MLFPNVGAQLNNLLQLYYTVNERLHRLESELRRAEDDSRAIRSEADDLKTRVAVLEETVRSLRAEMRAELRAVAAETVSELRVRFIEERDAPARPPQPPASLPRATEESSNS